MVCKGIRYIHGIDGYSVSCSCSVDFSAWHGVQVEGADHYHILVFWESLAHLKAASEDAYYPTLSPALPIADSTLLRRVFEFKAFPEIALTAPVTDLSYMSLKEGFNFETHLEPTLVKFTQLKDVGALGAYWGHSMEVDRLSVILAGWNRVQARRLRLPHLVP